MPRAWKPRPFKACPVTPGRLADLYNAPMSIEDLRNHLQTLTEDRSRPSGKLVQRWMSDAGITKRTVQESQRIWRKTKPESAARVIDALHAGRDASEAAKRGNAKALRAKRSRKRLVKALRPIWQAKYETRICVWCGGSFERLGCYIRRAERAGQVLCCGRACSCRHAAHARWLKRIRGGVSQISDVPEWLRDALEQEQCSDNG